jgi:hypothetical protein
LRAQLGLGEPPDPRMSLHRTVTVLGAGLIVRDQSGYPAESPADRNPWPWRARASAVMDRSKVLDRILRLRR